MKRYKEVVRGSLRTIGIGQKRLRGEEKSGETRRPGYLRPNSRRCKAFCDSGIGRVVA